MAATPSKFSLPSRFPTAGQAVPVRHLRLHAQRRSRRAVTVPVGLALRGLLRGKGAARQFTIPRREDRFVCVSCYSRHVDPGYAVTASGVFWCDRFLRNARRRTRKRERARMPAVRIVDVSARITIPVFQTPEKHGIAMFLFVYWLQKFAIAALFNSRLLCYTGCVVVIVSR